MVPELYDQLRGIAARVLVDEQRPLLQPTELVHEAYLRLQGQENVARNERAYLLAAAAGVIRRILIDHARKRGAAKRGDGRVHITLTPELCLEHADELDIESLHVALGRLAEIDERQARVVECRYFAGMNIEETALALGTSPATVKRDWTLARAWLKDRLG